MRNPALGGGPQGPAPPSVDSNNYAGSLVLAALPVTPSGLGT